MNEHVNKCGICVCMYINIYKYYSVFRKKFSPLSDNMQKYGGAYGK
jgi:hypothetical protein